MPSRQTSGKLSPMREAVSAHSRSVPRTSGRTGRLFLALLSVRRCRRTTWVRDALLLLLVRASGGTPPCACRVRTHFPSACTGPASLRATWSDTHTCCVRHLSRVQGCSPKCFSRCRSFCFPEFSHWGCREHSVCG